MYLYYWLSIAGYRDLWFKRYITQMQILQFILVISMHGSVLNPSSLLQLIPVAVTEPYLEP